MRWLFIFAFCLFCGPFHRWKCINTRRTRCLLCHDSSSVFTLMMHTRQMPFESIAPSLKHRRKKERERERQRTKRLSEQEGWNNVFRWHEKVRHCWCVGPRTFEFEFECKNDEFHIYLNHLDLYDASTHDYTSVIIIIMNVNMNIKSSTVQKARDRKKEHDRVDLLWFFEKKIMEKKFEVCELFMCSITYKAEY